jgi:predicted lipase
MSVFDRSKAEKSIDELAARINDMFRDLEVENEDDLIQEIDQITESINQGK